MLELWAQKMIIGKKWIERFLRWGWIYCNPAPKVITEVSFNVTLGNGLWKLKQGQYYREPVLPTLPAAEQYEWVEFDYYSIEPNQMYIAHTEEFCGSRVPFITTSMRTRSTFRRWGADVAMAAGMGEPNFHSRWALELHNSHDRPILIRAGWEVGQLSFSFCFGGGMYERHYNQPEETWTPEVLLPKSM